MTRQEIEQWADTVSADRVIDEMITITSTFEDTKEMFTRLAARSRQDQDLNLALEALMASNLYLHYINREGDEPQRAKAIQEAHEKCRELTLDAT